MFVLCTRFDDVVQFKGSVAQWLARFVSIVLRQAYAKIFMASGFLEAEEAMPWRGTIWSRKKRSWVRVPPEPNFWIGLS